jgi:hypothetical protein
MVRWFETRSAFEACADDLREVAQAAQEYVYRTGTLTGWCCMCHSMSEFTIGERRADWINLRESLFCNCGFNARSRLIFSALQAARPAGRFVLLERITPFFAKVAQRYPFAEGTEYLGADIPPGTVMDIGGKPVQHQDMLQLSFESESIDFLFHGDVLEHIPDIQRGLSECRRVLKTGGTLLFTCPIYNFENHRVRSRIRDGALEHLKEPVYHGNPVDAGGALVFTEPGWELLEDLRAAGFGNVDIGLMFDPFQGLLRDGNPYEEWNMWPLIFRCTK